MSTTRLTKVAAAAALVLVLGTPAAASASVDGTPDRIPAAVTAVESSTADSSVVAKPADMSWQ
ncbi:hypothetical protein [Streptomyces yaizuensis]|uniref:Uncharacterized protein n=1 Tax=Streptomyces yaizuensis TaxID=2989713 RepID=A0ABQ5P4I5_9ACTN|nr:hypothetical protein [Streptomyces sp. YSPA8]GLF97388.1 hypothetical protein SYYSPA8_23845 [Streptomyces sp. YSPA8]